MTSDQAAEIVEYLHHAVGAIDALGIVVCVALGVIIGLLLTSRR